MPVTHKLSITLDNFCAGELIKHGDNKVANLFSVRPSRPKSFRAALLGAAAVAVVGGLTIEASPLATYPAVAAATVASAGPASFADVVDRVKGAVVSVKVKIDESNVSYDGDAQPMPNFPKGGPLEKFFRQFGEPGFGERGGPDRQQPRMGMAQGSGFFISSDGYIVTNNHVVEHAKDVTITTAEGKTIPARVVGTDPKTDLALLKVKEGGDYPYVSFAAQAPRVGDWVIAVGNPFGLGGTVSAGIVSARGRDIHSGPYDDFLQIDAPINRGNSGGPTFNLQGEVVGINTAIYSPNGGSVGIGFAIPSDLAKSIVAQLREHGTVTRGWLGVQIQEVTPALAKALGLPNEHGAVVADVTQDSPAAKAGIKPGDVIETFNGHDITRMRDLPLMVAETPVGIEAKLGVWRKNQETTLSLTVAEQPANLQAASNEESGTPETENAVGVQLETLTPELHRDLHVPGDIKGVVVHSISDSSPLATIDVQPGDVIESINQQGVTTPREAVEKLKAALSAPDKRLVLLLNRHGVNEYVALSDQSNQG